MESFEASNTCYNCETELAADAKFCHSCGQKRTTGKITVGRILGDFFENYFNLDAKLPRSIIPLLFQPGKLTKEYFKGKHKSYILPVQLFIVTVALFFAVLIYQSKDYVTGLNYQGFHDNMLQRIGKDSARYTVDSLLVNAKNGINEERAAHVLDSIFNDFLQIDSILNLDTLNFNVGPTGVTTVEESHPNTVNIALKDLALLDADSIITKYEIEGFWNKLLLGQALKTMQNEKSFFNELMQKSSWMSIFLMPLFALMLYILYIRQKRYYVEHLIFAFHFHALLFLVLTATLLLNAYENKTIAYVLQGYSLIYLYLAIKHYYNQNYLKTTLKFVLLLLSYIVVISLSFMITIVISLLLL